MRGAPANEPEAKKCQKLATNAPPRFYPRPVFCKICVSPRRNAKKSATPEIVDIFGFNNINYSVAPLFVHAFFLRFASTKRKFFTKKSVDSVFLRAR